MLHHSAWEAGGPPSDLRHSAAFMASVGPWRVVRAPILVLLLLAGCATPTGPDEPARTPPSEEPAPGGLPTPSAAGRPSPAQATPAPTARPAAPDRRFAGCSGEGPVSFEQAPMREQDVRVLLPYGLVVGAHVTPIDHMYFEPADRTLGRDAYEVRAIADGVIYNLQPREVNVDTGAAKAREWRMDIAHTCTFTSYFDLLTSITPELEAAYNASRAGGRWEGVHVDAGQLVGHIGAQTLDFGVYDYNVTLPGFVRPDHYGHETWKVHTVDPFPSFPDEPRAWMLAKMLRAAEPRAGKIDHDVDGTLQGNWFKVGTNYYSGVQPSYYWEGHLAIAPDAYDPSHFFFSIGNFSGSARQFGIQGNADPKLVTPESGPRTWELVQYVHRDNVTGAYGFHSDGVRPGNGVTAINREEVFGTVVLQMTGPRALKLEVFPGREAAQVSGFTEAAWTYER